MPTIEFTDSAVAFIDVLGFKAVTQSAASDFPAKEKLSKLVTLLEGAVPTLDAQVSSTVPISLIPRHLYVSDSIIISAPLSTDLQGWSHYDGLSIIVMRAIQLTHALASEGYLLRGGIAVGKVWQTNSNVVGPAYIEAYLAEQSASAPRIVLTSSARDFWLQRHRDTSRMCIEYRGAFMVNGLHDFYIPGKNSSRSDAAFNQYEAAANQVLSTASCEAVRTKWKWFKQYLAEERSHATKYSGYA